AIGAREMAEVAPNAEQIKVPKQRLRAASEGAIVVDVDLPAGYHLNSAAPQRFKASIEAGPEHIAFGSDPKGRNDKVLSQTSKDLRLPLRVPVRALSPGNGELRIQLTIFYCREDNTGACQIRTVVWTAPVEVVSETNASNEIRVQAKLVGE